MTAAAVSVVVPVFNGARYLAEAIDSISSQQIETGEIIVVDDGSSDDSASVIAGFGDRIISVRQPNLGPGAARNAGIARSTFPLVAFLDADDLWMPRALAHQLACLNANPMADVAWGLSDRLVLPGVAPLDDWHGRPQWGMYVGSMLFRRASLEQVGGFDPSLRGGGEDTDLVIRLTESGSIVRHANIVHVARLHGENGFTLDETAMKQAHFRAVSRALARRRLRPGPNGASEA